MGISKGSALACLKNGLKRLRRRGWNRVDEKEKVTCNFASGRRASAHTQKLDLKDLITTCSNWSTTLQDLPPIPKRKDSCWIFFSDLTSEVQGLRNELLKLQRDVTTMNLDNNEIAILEDVLRHIHGHLDELPNSDGVLADKNLLPKPKISFWRQYRLKKHSRTLEDAALSFQNARHRVQNFRIGIATDPSRHTSSEEETEKELPLSRLTTAVVRPVKMTRNDRSRRKPWLLQRISTSFSNLSQSTLQAAHPPQVEI
jgi:hypothetical protein